MWIRWVWDRYEIAFAKLLGLKPLAPGSLLRIRPITYHGPALRSGEQELRPGMKVLELHLDNPSVAEMGQQGGAISWRIRRRLRTELPLLCQTMQSSYPDAAGVIATSLLARGAFSLGFHLEVMPAGLTQWWYSIYMAWLDHVYRTTARPSGEKLRNRKVATLWLTAAELAAVTRPRETKPDAGWAPVMTGTPS